MQPKSNPVTPAGYAAMKARYDHLLGTERPEIVEIVSWAAGNGDRSENGDYLYGRKRMREIDRELSHLARRMKTARVIDPVEQPDKSRAFFGATVTLADEDDNERVVTLVGDDEQDASSGRIPRPGVERRVGRRSAQRQSARRREGMGNRCDRLCVN